MAGLKTNRIDHYMTADLTAEFGENGWKQFPDAVFRQYRFVPASVEVDEHHIGLYASKTDGHMVKAGHPKGLLHGSPVSPTLAAAIMNGKYLKALFIVWEFKRYGLAITRQNMANWMIRLGEEYLSNAFSYLLNQEKYLRVFLANRDVPMDNNASERGIRGFCIGKKNWEIIDTINGVKAIRHYLQYC